MSLTAWEAPKTLGETTIFHILLSPTVGVKSAWLKKRIHKPWSDCLFEMSARCIYPVLEPYTNDELFMSSHNPWRRILVLPL